MLPACWGLKFPGCIDRESACPPAGGDDGLFQGLPRDACLAGALVFAVRCGIQEGTEITVAVTGAGAAIEGAAAHVMEIGRVGHLRPGTDMPGKQRNLLQVDCAQRHVIPVGITVRADDVLRRACGALFPDERGDRGKHGCTTSRRRARSVRSPRVCFASIVDLVRHFDHGHQTGVEAQDVELPAEDLLYLQQGLAQLGIVQEVSGRIIITVAARGSLFQDGSPGAAEEPEPSLRQPGSRSRVHRSTDSAIDVLIVVSAAVPPEHQGGPLRREQAVRPLHEVDERLGAPRVEIAVEALDPVRRKVRSLPQTVPVARGSGGVVGLHDEMDRIRRSDLLDLRKILGDGVLDAVRGCGRLRPCRRGPSIGPAQTGARGV